MITSTYPTDVQFYTEDAALPLWERLGVKLDRKIYSAQEALILAGANWGVYKVPLVCTLTDPNTDEVYEFKSSRKFAVFRDTDNHYLGCVGQQFTLVQNLNGFTGFSPYLENQSAFVESAGTLRQGEIVWLICQMERDAKLEVVSGDYVEQRVLLTLCHNTNHAPAITLLNSRVLGQTILTTNSQAARVLQRGFRLRQTKSVNQRLEHIQQNIAAAKTSFYEDVESYRRLAQKFLSKSNTDLILEELFASQLSRLALELNFQDDVGVYLKSYRPTAYILDLLDSHPSLQTRSTQGTAWGLYCALSHYTTYWRLPSRRGKSKIDSQLEAIWFGAEREILCDFLKVVSKY